MIIAIDGPAGSGKSSVARELAKRLHIHHLRTGLLYRAAAHVILGRHVGEQKVFNFLKNPTEQDLQALKTLVYSYDNGEPIVSIAGVNITPSLENAELDYAASTISSVPQVREQLLHIQRAIAQKYDLIAEGRDCCSVVFPHAEYKFFLTARPEVRAERVMKDLKRGISSATKADVLQAINDRDERDKVRVTSPLIATADAHLIDNSELTLDQTILKMLEIINQK